LLYNLSNHFVVPGYFTAENKKQSNAEGLFVALLLLFSAVN